MFLMRTVKCSMPWQCPSLALTATYPQHRPLIGVLLLQLLQLGHELLQRPQALPDGAGGNRPVEVEEEAALLPLGVRVEVRRRSAGEQGEEKRE